MITGILLRIFIYISLRLETSSTVAVKNTCNFIPYIGKSKQDPLPCKAVCNKTYNVLITEDSNYLLSLSSLGYIMLACCSRCEKFAISPTWVPNIAQISPTLFNSSHISTTFLGRSNARRLYGYNFIPIYKAPYLLYITTRKERFMSDLLSACFDLYPLISTCLLMAIVSGYLIWIIELWSNEEEFPKIFFVGWFDGFWWSFISMTTVGYGDKTPKSVLGRFYAVLWILVGIISFGILTASLISAITNAANPPQPTMDRSIVGALAHNTYDASVIAARGGKYRPTNYSTGSFASLIELFSKLENGQIDGFAMNWMAYSNAIQAILMRKGMSVDEMQKWEGNFVTTKVIYKEEHLSYGLIVRDDSDYDYLKDAFSDFRIIHETTFILEHNKDGVINPTKLNYFNQYFNDAIKGVGIILGIISFIGIIYEILRRTVFSQQQQEQSTTMETDHEMTEVRSTGSSNGVELTTSSKTRHEEDNDNLGFIETHC